MESVASPGLPLEVVFRCLEAFVATIEATGGVKEVEGETIPAPAGAPEWLDLGIAYMDAVEALKRAGRRTAEPMYEALLEPELEDDGRDPDEVVRAFDSPPEGERWADLRQRRNREALAAFREADPGLMVVHMDPRRG